MADIGGDYEAYKKQKQRTKIGKTIARAFKEKHGTAPNNAARAGGRTSTCTLRRTGAGSRRAL